MKVLPLFLLCIFIFTTYLKVKGQETILWNVPAGEEKNTDFTLYGNPGIPHIINNVAVPADFPVLEVEIDNENAMDDYLFVANANGNPYLLIYKNDGTPVFYRKLKEQAGDFKLNCLNILSYSSGNNPPAFVTMDSCYQILKTWRTKKYRTDDHDFIYTSDKTAFMIGIDSMHWDLSDSVEGGRKSIVLGNVVQEIGPSGNIIFEWHSKDHFKLADSDGQSLTSAIIDYVHINSIALDYDNHLLISSRHLNECTKINRLTGKIIWRFGGKNNQFTLLNDEGFSYQHDFRPVPGKPLHYTLFDNGAQKTPSHSRAVEYRLDTVSMQAEKVWEYCPEPFYYSHWMGNAQRLRNGNTQINFVEGYYPKFLEISPEGNIVYQANFANSSQAYRAFKFPWKGVLKVPELIIEPYPELLSLIFNKFGDDSLVAYNIYLDRTPGSSKLYARTAANWLNIAREELENGKTYFIRVTGVYEDGSESLPSEEKEINIYFVPEGGNLIRNGDFSETDSYWELKMDENIRASTRIEEEVYIFSIQKNGNSFSGIQLSQGNLCLVKGNKYLFSFTASASAPGVIEAIIGKGSYPVLDLGRIGPTYITQKAKEYQYIFTMQDPTEFNSSVLINVGRSLGEVKIENLSLKKITDPTTLPSATATDPMLRVIPMEGSTVKIEYSAQNQNTQNLSIIDLSGRVVREYRLPPSIGQQYEFIDISGINAGIYIFRLSGNPKMVKSYLNPIQ